MTLVGTLTHESAPLADCDVLLGDLGARAVRGAARTDPQGAYALDVPPGVERALVLARCAGEVVGAAAAEVTLPAPEPVDLVLPAPTFAVAVDLDGELPPAGQDVFLTLIPAAIDGVTDLQLGFAFMPVDGLAQLGWFERGLQDTHAELQVQAGRWSVAAARLVVAAANAPGLPEPTSWVTVAAEADGRPLERGPAGYELELRGPVHLRLTLEARAFA